MVTEHLGELATWKGEQYKRSCSDSVQEILYYAKILFLSSFISSFSIYMVLGLLCERCQVRENVLIAETSDTYLVQLGGHFSAEFSFFSCVKQTAIPFLWVDRWSVTHYDQYNGRGTFDSWWSWASCMLKAFPWSQWYYMVVPYRCYQVSEWCPATALIDCKFCTRDMRKFNCSQLRMSSFSAPMFSSEWRYKGDKASVGSD
jgi:hypothetical protein